MEKYIKIIPLLIIAISLIAAYLLSPYLPPLMATHWNIQGMADGYGSKLFALLFLPALSLVLYIVFLFLPRLEPYQKNFNQFRSHYYWFILVIIIFLFYIYFLSLAWNLGLVFDFNRLISPAFALLFFFIARLSAVARRNWFVGIRTPWTMIDDNTWVATHRRYSRLMFVCSTLVLMGIVLPSITFYIIFSTLLISTLFAFIYSYWYYANTKGKAHFKV